MSNKKKDWYTLFVVWKFAFWVIFAVNLFFFLNGDGIGIIFLWTALEWLALVVFSLILNSVIKGKKRGLKMIQYLFLPKFITDFFHIDIIRTKYFIVNGWTFVHMGWGLILAFTFTKVPQDYIPQNMYWLFALVALTFYEVLELVFWRRKIIIGDKKGNFFVDAFWDIVFGMIAFFIGCRVF